MDLANDYSQLHLPLHSRRCAPKRRNQPRLCVSLSVLPTGAQMQTWSQKCPADGCAWSLKLWTEDLQRQQQADRGAGKVSPVHCEPQAPLGICGGMSGPN